MRGIKTDKWTAYIVTFVIIVCTYFQSINTYASSLPTWNILHEQKTTQLITKGVVYEMNRWLTDKGWLDVHVMKIDLTDPYVRLGVVETTGEYGSTAAMTDLVKNNGAIAGINGDFFDMSKNPTGALGMVMTNGEFVSAYNYNNSQENRMATFLLDEQNNPFFEFIKTRMFFFNEKNVYIEIGAMNKVSSFARAVYVDRNIGQSTADLDKRQEALYKIVVENDRVSYISKRGEVVSIPENGYVIVMNEPTAVLKRAEFQVGQKVTFDLQTSVDLAHIEVALGGAGKILENGKLPANPGHVIDGAQRPPRSAIGISKDKKQVILLAVDGRNHSLGATHQEMAALLLRHGAYEGMHLDGGGSTTMVGRTLGINDIQVFNTPSGGTQRRVSNGLGIFSEAPKGSLTGISIQVDTPRVFLNTGMKITVVGYDEYYNPVNISWNDIKWEVSGINGGWKSNEFYPSSIGKGRLTAQIGTVYATLDFTSEPAPKALVINPKDITLAPNESISYQVMGITEEGYRIPITSESVEWKLSSNIGTIHQGRFTAGANGGQAVLEAGFGNAKVYGQITVGGQIKPVNSFETAQNIQFTSFPSTVEVKGAYASQPVYDGKQSIGMTYRFITDTTDTQAAYIQFNTPIAFAEQPTALGLWVHGDNSGHWLRGRIVDAKGTQHNITFAQNVNWTGWKYVQAPIPKEAAYPISLDRVYVASLSNQQSGENKMFIDQLSAVYPLIGQSVALPKDTAYIDPLRKTLDTAPTAESFDITIFGATAGKNRLIDYIVQKQVIKAMEANAELSIFSGQTDIDQKQVQVPMVKWSDTYGITDYKNVRVIQLATSKGGLRTTNPEQWKKFQADLIGTPQDHIIIHMNKDILDSKSFTDPLEAELFHNIIKEYRETTKKNVFVISAQGYETNVQARDGIRYININGLWYKDLDLINSFSILRFRIQGDRISYDIIPVLSK